LQENERRPIGAHSTAIFLRMLILSIAVVLAFMPISRAAQVNLPTENSSATKYVYPMGRAVGIKLFSEGVLVIGLSDVQTTAGSASPAESCGIREGDIITHMNSAKVDTIEDVQAILEQVRDGELKVEILREQKQAELVTHAVQCSTDGSYKLGAWIRDSMAGIGTITFCDPATGLFGTLGHGINDIDTGMLMPLQSGSIMYASVVDIKKGIVGEPGALHGQFRAEQDMGTLFANTKAGVFGHITDQSLMEAHELVPVATAQEVQSGPATILSNLSGESVEEFQVTITKLSGQDTRSLMVEVTDPRLLQTTGGIVQGMSGSPILQNGKLVGAVTHVLVNDPTKGYGILIETMLDTAENID